MERECCECKCGCKITPVVIVAFLVGIIVGFVLAPIKKGFSPKVNILSFNKGNGSNNGSKNGCDNRAIDKDDK